MTTGDENRNWLEPWEPVADGQPLEGELHREIGESHALYGHNVRAIARRGDQDDVLFELEKHTHRFALVHLTWSGQRERDARWPATTFFGTWSDWLEQMTVDRHEFQ